MNVLNVTLIAIVAPLMIVLVFGFPLILAVKGKEAWRNVPHEVYASHQQRLAGVRPIFIWITSALLSQIGRLFEWLNWQNAERIAERASLVVMVVVLVYHLVWATRIIRSRSNIDARLVRFARYALCGTAACLLAYAAGIALILATS